MGALRFSCHTSITGGNGCGGTPLAQHAGLDVLHCHNLERADAGMMLSLEVS